MRPVALDSANEVEQVVRNLLRESKAWGHYPTPVDQIAKFGELAIERKIDLGKADEAFLPRQFGFLSSALKKILGLIDFRHRKIYLDQTISPNRQNFIKLHEVGHGVLPWQRELREGYGDDEFTLSPEIDEQFELIEAHMEEVRKLNPDGTFPTICIDKVVLTGFNEDKVRKALNLP